MKNFKRAFIKKIKGFRPTVVSVIMVVLVTYRMFCSGKGIIIAGVCASIVPFICQLRNYPEEDRESSETVNILADYFLNIFYMIVYLLYILLVTWLGIKLNPAYVMYSYFRETFLLAVSVNMILISVMYTIGGLLTEKQRMMTGIILINAQLGVMLLSGCIVSGTALINIYCIGFTVLIVALTLGTVYFSYHRKE